MQIPKYLDTDNELNGALDPGGIGRELYQFLQACFTNDTHTIQTLLKKDNTLCERAYISNPIGFAVYGGSEDAIRILLGYGARPKSNLRFNDDLLSFSRARGDSGIYQLILSALQENYNYRKEQTPVTNLFKAIKDSDINAILSLLSLHSDLALASDVHGKTPLHVAAENSVSKDILDALIKSGATLQLDTNQKTPLDVAFDKSNVGFIRYFTQDRTDDITTLAFFGDNQRLMEILTSNEIQLSENHSWHALSVASKTNNLQGLEYLLRHFPQTWQPEKQMYLDDALDKAVGQSHVDVIKLLLENGADPNNKPSVTHAAFRKRDDIVELLHAYGGFISPWDLCGKNDLNAIASLLHYAPELSKSEKPILVGRSAGDNLFTSGSGSTEMIKLLYKYGGDPSPTSNWCNSYTWNHLDTSSLLLDLGADPNMKTMTSATPLHLVFSWRPKIEVAKLLVDRGGHIDAVEELSGTTPLGYASASGNLEAMSTLVDRGANPNPPVEPWATPLAIAERYNKTEAIEYLKRLG